MGERSTDNWLEKRLPVASFIRRAYGDFPMPDNLNALWAFGGFLLVALGLLGVSGVFLALNYTPTTADAFDCIETIERQVSSGWLVRGLHLGGVTMMFAALYIHVGRGLWYGSYRAPRELVWLTGLGLMLMAMTTAFAGYILPWGQMSYWGATVAVNALNAVPGIGHPLSTWLLGGEGLGSVALHRFYVLHFVTAFCMIWVVALHVSTLHVTGPNNPTGRPRPAGRSVPFHPWYTSADAFGVCLFLMVYAALVFFLPDLLTTARNSVMANPLVTPHDITPEWYFAPFYAILRAVPSRLAGLVLAAGSLAVLFAVPWLDRSREGVPPRALRAGLMGVFVSFLMLGVAGLNPPTSLWLWVARMAIGVWYLYFLVLLPVLSRRASS